MILQKVCCGFGYGSRIGVANKAICTETGHHRCRKKLKQRKQYVGNGKDISNYPLTQLTSRMRSKGINVRMVFRLLNQLGTRILSLTEGEISAAIAAMLLRSMTMVTGIYTTLSPTTPAGVNGEESLEPNDTCTSDLLVCLPDNSTTGCVKYVNSTKNGLIELNER